MDIVKALDTRVFAVMFINRDRIIKGKNTLSRDFYKYGPNY